MHPCMHKCMDAYVCCIYVLKHSIFINKRTVCVPVLIKEKDEEVYYV